MNEDEKIKAIIDSLRDRALGDIKRASSGEAKMGAFILCSCLIDSIAGFAKGSNTTKQDFEQFITKNMNKYDGKKLYKDLRCKLVHSYSEGGSYMFTDNNPAGHLQKVGTKTLINLEEFIGDIEKVFEGFAKEIQDKRAGNSMRLNAIKRYNKNGVIELFSFANISCLTPIISGSNI